MSTKRMGRPSTVDAGASQNVYMPAKQAAYVHAFAKANYLSYSAAMRLIVEAHMRANHGEPRALT